MDLLLEEEEVVQSPLERLKQLCLDYREFRQQHTKVIETLENFSAQRKALEDEVKTKAKSEKTSMKIEGLEARYSRRMSTLIDVDILLKQVPLAEKQFPGLIIKQVNGTLWKDVIKRGKISPEVQKKVETKIPKAEVVTFSGDCLEKF